MYIEIVAMQLLLDRGCYLSLQWLPLPVFVLYRIFLFLYLAAWLVAHGVVRSDTVGVRWLIFITNWTVLFLTFAMLVAALVTLIYFISGNKDGPDEDSSVLYNQDNTHWGVKIFWLIYITAATMMILVFFGFWIAVYEPCGDSDNDSIGSGSAQNSSAGNDSDEAETGCGADAVSIHAHGVTAALVMIDVILCLIPFSALHFFYPCIFSSVYIIFSAIYFAADGTDELGRRFIYSVLDYGDSPGTASLVAIVLALVPALVYFIPFLLALARDWTYRWIMDKHPVCCRSMSTCQGSSEGLI